MAIEAIHPEEIAPVYKHGLPFSEVLAWNLTAQNDRVQTDRKASLIIVDGGVGEGKTTLIVEILDYINSLHGHPVIQIEDHKLNAGPQLSMGGADFIKKLAVCHELKLVCLGYDEAGDFSKRGALTKFNAMLNRTFETYRGYKILVVLGLPCFDILDQPLFDNQVPRMLLHLSGRTLTHGSFDGYGLDEMNWIRFWMQKWPKHKQKAYGKVIPNFRGHFLDLSPARSKMLDRVSTKNKLKILRKSSIIAEGLLNYQDLAQKLEKSVIWVRKAVGQLNIKHTRTLSSVKYFDPDALNKLADFAEEQAPAHRPKGSKNKVTP